ncbi:hypothetical protein [Pseudomonas sp. 30_B]|uniref:hypothetical protein n=1 Tax=Pseudomonas sp. 30_B TaxID=2813575 RepID=UPI001A9DD28E|nr:hypothetical protein [Pseudomonas sp. 30_B]
MAVFLRDPEQTASVPQQPLRQLFSFTPTEAELAAQLACALHGSVAFLCGDQRTG